MAPSTMPGHANQLEARLGRAPDSAWVSVRNDVRRLETRALTTTVFLLEFLLVGLDGN